MDVDTIIVGGGSAGCALAARLSERSTERVLVIEGLVVREATEDGDRGTVTFDARLRAGDQDLSFAERSRFARRTGVWPAWWSTPLPRSPRRSLLRSMGVSMKPGGIVLTVIPSGPSSRARVFSQPTTPGRTAFESARLAIGSFTEVDSIAMMRPRPLSRR